MQELVPNSPYCTFKMSADVIAAVGDVMSGTLEALGALAKISCLFEHLKCLKICYYGRVQYAKYSPCIDFSGINALSASLMDTVGTWIGDFQTSIDAFLLAPRRTTTI